MATRTITLQLEARELQISDIPGLAWSGSPLHVGYLADQLRITPRAKDYLAVFLPNGQSAAKGEVSYQEHPDAGAIGSLAVRADLQSLGIGTFLIETAERWIQTRGLRRAVLDVEDNNPRAKQLYERLGYVAYDRQPDSWDQQRPDGTIYWYETMCTLMRKDLIP
jgi:ribosomal protein S18 acetylase RimI-like enzyme